MLGRTRIHTRARGSGAGAGSTTTTSLSRLLALSPSLLIWPANGAGWQGTSGGTLAASGQPLGLGADLSQLEGKTLGEWLAAPTTSQLWNTPSLGGAASWSWDGSTLTGLGVIAGEATGDAVIAGRVYLVTLRVTATGSGLFQVRVGGTFLATLTGGANTTYTYVATATNTTGLRFTSSGGTTGTIDNISVRELPGNHLRAGTWASPSDAARGTFQNDAIDFSGVDDFYSLLNAIDITESMTVVRAFKRASAGIRSAGLGEGAGGGNPRDFFWQTTNVQSYSLSGTTKTVSGSSTATGSFVSTVRRNASQEIARLNGTEIDAVTANAVAGSFGRFGDVAGSYNSGEISFLALFPTELTGADLALVEQIAASTNGSVLA